jgi:hypothetical protein
MTDILFSKRSYVLDKEGIDHADKIDPTRYVSGKLKKAQTSAIDGHLLKCHKCRKHLSSCNVLTHLSQPSVAIASTQHREADRAIPSEDLVALSELWWLTT